MSAVTRGGAASRGRLRARIATVVGAAALTVGLAAGTSSAEVIVQWYGYTSAGAKACNNAANVAGPEYYCKALNLGGSAGWVWALARP
ncbi:hypothetical protein ABZ695_29865 [Streptomyces sp. NPDC006976]|uniref:hypothetical protein n=1 Tax=Streptomyces sp. NPDC006976 TaxID=3154311 RepID=UPI0034013648